MPVRHAGLLGGICQKKVNFTQMQKIISVSPEFCIIYHKQSTEMFAPVSGFEDAAAHVPSA